MRLYREVIFPRINERISLRFDPERKELLSLASGDVLEIGFGSGNSAKLYSSAVESLTGLEPNAAMLKRAKVVMPPEMPFPVKLVQGSSERLPFDDKSFDCVVSVVTLCSVEDPKKTITEVRRVLRKDGRFLFIEHGLQSEPGITRAMQVAVNPVWRKLACGCNLTRSPIEEMKLGGLEVKEVQVIGRNGFPNLFSPIHLGVMIVKPQQ